ncbi:MAG: AAA domain-containing protein [Clostridium sp.]|nr:AAA domain-containing protein [Clostridium sp.]
MSMESSKDIFDELRRTVSAEPDTETYYRTLSRVVKRMVNRLTADFGSEFSCTNARIHALCHRHGVSPHPLLCLIAHAKAALHNDYRPTATDRAYDLKAVCEAIAVFHHTEVPSSLSTLYPRHWRPASRSKYTETVVKRIRLTVSRWDRHFLYGTDSERPETGELRVCFARTADDPFAPLYTQLYEGAQVNLLSVRTRNTSGNEEEETFLEPELIVLDPDFLIDITAVCACLRPHGTTPFNHLLSKFSPAPRGKAIRLGNTANEFLDDCVNASAEEPEMNEDQLYRDAMKKSFKQAPLDYTTLEDIDMRFFQECRQQFANIRRTVRQRFSAADIDIDSNDIQLEPSFLCEAMGLQGRMDLLVDDFRKIVELKSGKADEYPLLRPQEAHCLQMALYREILFYASDIPREDVQTFLFYSKYPNFFHIHRRPSDTIKAIALRNGILHIERMLRKGEGPKLLGALTEETFHTNGKNDRFYETYLRPSILDLIHTLHQASPLEKAYFHTFLAFTEREQFMAKTGDMQPDSGRGFAEVWNTDTQTKRLNGSILTDLILSPVTDHEGAVTHLNAEVPDYGDDFLPNFRQGDMVMLYERNTDKDKATNRQIYRCIIEEISPDRMLLKLVYRQRHTRVFHTDSRYALEPGYMDATFAQTYRGLFALLGAPERRRALLLGQTAPQRDESRKLCRPIENPDVARIVLRAKQAEDYFLLVGPPGTGKTSVALKAMVEEFLADNSSTNLLLSAYTNRAVDEICEMLETLSSHPVYVRIGQESSCDRRFRHRLIEQVVDKAESRRQIEETLRPIRLFTGTLSSLSGHQGLFALKQFDAALIDEASQILEPQLLPLLCATQPSPDGQAPVSAIRKFILIGDHKQLPAVVTQSDRESEVSNEALRSIGLTNCARSLFERLHRLQSMLHTEGIVDMLHRQGRMHPAICEFVNRMYYDNLLTPIPLPHQTETLICSHTTEDLTDFIATQRIGYVPVEALHTDNPKVNAHEAEIIADIVIRLMRLANEHGVPFDAARQVGVIVPFRGQIACVRKALERHGIARSAEMTIDTVERYQGSQRDIILYGTTISRPYQIETLSAPVCMDGQWIDRKLNVALTRARKQFFLVGDEALLRRSNAYNELIESIPAFPGRM